MDDFPCLAGPILLSCRWRRRESFLPFFDNPHRVASRIAISGAKSQSHDSKAELRRLPSLFTQEGPEDRPQAQPWDLQDARGRAEARARGAVLQAGRLTERGPLAVAAGGDQ